MRVGTKLRYIRYAVGISQRDLASIFGINRARLEMYELGLEPMPQSLRDDLERFFNLSDDYFSGLD